MADPIPLTLDTFFSGELTDLVNVAADFGTDRDRGQFDDSPYEGVDYGRDLVVLMDQNFPAVALRNEMARSPALEGLDPTITTEGIVTVVQTIEASLIMGREGLVNADIA